ncbi:MAG: hypothetical protein J7480_01515, partial [Microbacteriaceae bacterium]|nr:hypothetical protein [Microbacteriaceae bacterium]
MDGKATMTEARAAVDTVEVIRDPVTGSWSLGATEPVEGVEVLVAALAEDAPRTRRLRPRSPMDRFERWLAKVGTALVLWLRALPGRLPVAAARLDLLRTRLRRSVGHALQAARRVRFRLPRWAPVAAAGLLVAAGIATVVTVVVISPAPSAPADPAPVAPAAAGPAASIDRAFIDLDAVIAEGDALAAAVTADQLADPRAFSGLLGALVDAKAALGGTPQQAGRVMTELR